MSLLHDNEGDTRRLRRHGVAMRDGELGLGVAWGRGEGHRQA